MDGQKAKSPTRPHDSCPQLARALSAILALNLAAASCCRHRCLRCTDDRPSNAAQTISPIPFRFCLGIKDTRGKLPRDTPLVFTLPSPVTAE